MKIPYLKLATAAGLATLLAGTAAFAQETAPAAADGGSSSAPTPDKGDTTWMLISRSSSCS